MIAVLVALAAWALLAVVLGPVLGRRAGRRTRPPAGSGPAVAPRWAWVTAGVAVVLTLLVVLGTVVRLPYYTVAPGSALDVNELVTVSGARTYPTEGEVLLLFVRQRARVNVWRWVQASLDDDIDLFREEDFAPDRTPAELRTIAQADMERAQVSARKVALERLGYEVPVAEEGLTVLGVFSDLPAEGILERGDVLLAADGQRLEAAEELGAIVRDRDSGAPVELRFRRDGEIRTAEVGTAPDPERRPVIGVLVSRRYEFPVDIALDTGSIGGPSAGLAMTLSILDALSPGDLTGGSTVAVTGEIREDGSVGLVGGVAQKAVAARRAGAEVFLVPACPRPTALVEEGFEQERAEEVAADCRGDLERARARSDAIDVIPVETLDDALRALERSGGAALPAPRPAAAA